MRAWLAILFTISLWATCYAISAAAYFDFGMVLVWGTALWVGIDSSKIQLNRYKLDLACRPAVLSCLCVWLWFFVFPWYLWARHKIKTGRAVLKEETTNQELPPFKRFLRRYLPVTRRVAEWLLISLAVSKLGFEVFCLAESWRGKRAWAACKVQLAAKGETLDWESFIPPAVPDSKNIFAAPKMAEWFTKPKGKKTGVNGLASRLKYTNSIAEVLIAEVTVADAGALANRGVTATWLKFDDPSSRQQAIELIQDAAGPSVFGVLTNTGLFVGRSPDANRFKPAHLLLAVERATTPKDVSEFFRNQSGAAGALRIRPVGSNVFQVFTPVSTATEYLAWSDQFQDDFNLMSAALERPYARMKGKYRPPSAMPVQNFVDLRNVVQILAQRAKCFLLLGKPEEALKELTLLRSLCRLLEAAPTGKPMTLVGTMINVAVAGLYVDVLADGFRLHAWQEPQLTALQAQLDQINFAPFVVESVRSERAAILSPFEADVLTMFETSRVPGATLWQKFKNLKPPYPLKGFFYLNMVTVAELDQAAIESIDPIRKIVLPKKVIEVQRKVEAMRHHFPYTFFAAIAVPNFAKAWRTFAYNQTKVDEAQIACALERFSLAQGNYPEALNALIPKFIQKLPHDIIGGEPLKYRRKPDGKFLLYSVGWNETDDRGQPSSPPNDHGDWVWP